MKQLIWLVFFCPLVIIAQENNEGIQWTKGLSWEQVRTKAKEENKYIFLDCYATWCGPCKMMDKDVYPLDSVGRYFNETFISVKVQMDVTENDDQSIVAWRKDAELMGAKFNITGLPTFLFFSTEGVLVHRSGGGLTAGRFLAEGRTAAKSGQVYVDPEERITQEATQEMDKYLKGQIPPDSAFGLYELCGFLGWEDKKSIIQGDLYKYLAAQPIEQLFTADRLKFIASITTHSTQRWFPFFQKYSKRVNQVMKDKNYSERLVVSTILSEVATPLLHMEMSGRMMANLEVLGKEDKKEADWITLRKNIRKKVNKSYTERSILAARFIWYQVHMNTTAFGQTYLEFLNRYGLDSHLWTTPGCLNDFAYNIFFMKIGDKEDLRKIANWMKLIVGKKEDQFMEYLDTYASLLYRLGEKEEALRWEKRALEKARERHRTSDVALFESVIAKMEKGEKLNWLD